MSFDKMQDFFGEKYIFYLGSSYFLFPLPCPKKCINVPTNLKQGLYFSFVLL